MELTIAMITAFVGVLNEGTKSIAKSLDKDINKYIPIFSIIYGVILGVCGYFMPDTIVGKTLLESIVIGVSAGLASTGCHQVFHQLSKDHDADGTDEDATLHIGDLLDLVDDEEEEEDETSPLDTDVNENVEVDEDDDPTD